MDCCGVVRGVGCEELERYLGFRKTEGSFKQFSSDDLVGEGGDLVEDTE